MYKGFSHPHDRTKKVFSENRKKINIIQKPPPLKHLRSAKTSQARNKQRQCAQNGDSTFHRSQQRRRLIEKVRSILILSYCAQSILPTAGQRKLRSEPMQPYRYKFKQASHLFHVENPLIVENGIFLYSYTIPTRWNKCAIWLCIWGKGWFC